MGMVMFAHIGHVVEPLMFLPAFIAVGWSIASSRRTLKKEDPDA